MLKKILGKKETELNEVRDLIEKGTDLNEVKKLIERAKALESEIDEIRTELSKAETKADIPADAVRKGEFKTVEKRTEDELDSMEYRQAFFDYIKTGVWNYRGTDAFVGTGDTGKTIPNTVFQEYIRDLHSYGQLYNRVRKISVKGGVEFPIETLVPEVKWINEGVRSENQKAPEIKTSVSFSYYIAEARIAQSLLSEIVSLPQLEKEIARLLAEAFIKEFDKMIVSGAGTTQPLGILNDTRVATANKIDVTQTNMLDWKFWRTNLFAKVPLALRNRGILVMSVGTWESYMMTLKDNSNRPLYEETFNATNGEQVCRFNAKEVVLVEDSLLPNFDSATNGAAFAIYFDPQQYCINSNQTVSMKRFFDENINQWINKMLCVIDGKLLSTQCCFILKKSVPSP